MGEPLRRPPFGEEATARVDSAAWVQHDAWAWQGGGSRCHSFPCQRLDEIFGFETAVGYTESTTHGEIDLRLVLCRLWLDGMGVDAPAAPEASADRYATQPEERTDVR